MPGLQFMRPVRAIAAAAVVPGALLSVKLTGTETAAALFADPDMTVRLGNPLASDFGGYFPAIYVSPNARYDVDLTDEFGNVLDSVDDFLPLIAPLALDASDPLDLAGRPMPLATLTFYRARTTELRPVFADQGLTVELDNPVAADLAGVFPEMWLDPATPARVILEDGDGVLQFDVDQYDYRTEILPPSAPVLSGELVEVDFELEWTASISLFSTIGGYLLYKSIDGAPYVLLVDQPGLTYLDTNVDEGHFYSYYVVGYDANDLESPPSNTVAITLDVLLEVIEISRDWIKPPNLLTAKVTCIAGGAGGRGGGGHNSLSCYSGHAGGAGGITEHTYNAVDLPDTVACTIGAGGNGGAGGNSAVRGALGDVGGDTLFGALLSASGGGAGINETGGVGGAGALENGGDGSNGQVNNTSNPDIPPGESTTASGAGGGGGGFGNGVGTVRQGGNGGSTATAAGGAHGASVSANFTGDLFGNDGSDGANGTDYGAGAGGGGGGACINLHNDGGTGPSTAHAGKGGKGGKYGGGGGGGGQAQRGGSAIRSFGGDGGDGGQGAIILRYTYIP